MAFTFFFRDMNTFNVVEKHVFPWLKSQRYIDIWDAGCATGAEPYTLAILLHENMGQFQFRNNVRITATDVNSMFRDTIAAGAYPQEQVSRIPRDLFDRYFAPHEQSGHYVLSDVLRKSISFQQHDLSSLIPIRDNFRLVVCKNVLLHLNPEQRVGVLKMFHDSLCEGGFLAVEQTQKLPSEAQGWFKPVTGCGPVFQKC